MSCNNKDCNKKKVIIGIIFTCIIVFIIGFILGYFISK